MKNKVPEMLKHRLAVLSAMAKSKSLALRRKTDAFRTRLIIFSLLHHDKKFFISTLSHKLQNLLSHHHHHHHHHNHDGDKPREEVEDADVAAEQMTKNVIMSYSEGKALVQELMPVPAHCEPAKDEDEDDGDEEGEKYQDLRHTLFDDIEDPSSGGSVIELVKHSKEDRGEEFVLENEIDHVADLFIRRFHQQMRLQKMESFKNYQEMLRKSV